jgi:hypothetical protein
MNNHTSDERAARIEGILERVLYEIGDIKGDLRDNRAEGRETRAELKKEIQESRAESRNDFRFLLGALLTVALGLLAVMARVFGWM